MNFNYLKNNFLKKNVRLIFFLFRSKLKMNILQKLKTQILNLIT